MSTVAVRETDVSLIRGGASALRLTHKDHMIT